VCGCGAGRWPGLCRLPLAARATEAAPKLTTAGRAARARRLDPRRAFPTDLRHQLFQESPVCAICGQLIQDVNLAEVDHVVPFSKGGPTSAGNAQLVHRFCNRSKGNRELGG
jgi:5-methylcytosine-specific restriction endonuclease McrA